VVTALVPLIIGGISMSQSKISKSAKGTRGKGRRQAPRKARPKTASKASKANARQVRGGSKQEAMLGLLQQPAGATVAALMKASGWQQHSVRGFLAGVVQKRLKLKLDSKKIDDVRVYRIVGRASAAAPAGEDRQVAAR
jgi:hypothetical protein